MNSAARISIALISCTILLHPLWAYTTRNVHILVIDGARYSETFGDSTHQFIPNIWNKLRPQGTIYKYYYNDGITYTTAGHGSIISGVWQNIPNDGTVSPSSPTVFEYFRKELLTSPFENFVILGKDKLYILATSSHPDYGSAFGASIRYSVSPYEDILTWQNITSVFSTYHPRLTITNLASVDVCGHNGIWEEYVRAIRVADSVVNETWNLIQSDPMYKDKTTLIVTNDHGRHSGDDWPSHGDDCDGCRHILLLIIGPDIQAGMVDTVRRTQIDIAPTIGELLDFSTPLCKGTSLIPVRPPATPILVSPGSDTIHQMLYVSLRWAPVSRTERYHIQLSTDAQFVQPLTDDSLLTWNSENVGPLSIKTVYYWRVRSINSGGASAWSSTRRFTTVPVMPPVVILAAPENAAMVSRDSVHFSWSATAVEVDRYKLEIALDSLMTMPVFQDTQITENSTVHKYYRNKTVFFWRVKAHSAFGWADWSATWRFIVNVPVAFQPPDNFNFALEGRRKPGSPVVLKYALPKASSVTIRLYAINGRRIQTIVNSWQTPDFYRVAMPTQALSRGFYLLDFKAGRYRASRLFFRS